jgi:hypothetical protein
MAENSAKINYTPGPMIEKFITSSALYTVCMGGRGSGKTTGGFFRAIMYAQNLPKKYHPVKVALIRDTRRNIGTTTARTIKKWCPKPYSVWTGKEDEPERCTIIVNNQPLLTIDMFGVNSPADHDKFQSFECAFVWIEEPCPLATNTEFIASGVAESVLASAVTSMRLSPRPTVQLTLNPPSADNWVAQLFHIPGYECMDVEVEMPKEQIVEREKIRAQTEIFAVPPSECAAEIESPGYTERNRQMLLGTGRSDLYARLVEGRIGTAQVGERVTPEFNASHLSAGLQVIPNVPFLLSFDYGLNPTCVVAQISPTGYLLIHKAWSEPNKGMKQLLQAYVHPWLTQQAVTTWSYCGGPEAVEREQSDSEETALRMIQRTLGQAAYRSGPVGWSARREALRDALTRSPGGLPWVRINPQGAALLVRCLDGGWHYPTDSQGHIRNDSPDKRSRWDHLGDAFSHLCAILLRKTDQHTGAKRNGPSPVSRLSAQRQRFGLMPSSGSSRTGV